MDAAPEHMDETIRHDGAEWLTEGPRGILYLIRWFSATGNIAAWRASTLRKVGQGRAATIEEARHEASWMAGLIAGKN